MPAYCVVISCSSPCSMQMHFPEVTQINNASGSDDIIIGLYIGQTTPEAEMLKRLDFGVELHIIHPELVMCDLRLRWVILNGQNTRSQLPPCVLSQSVCLSICLC